MNSSPRGRGSDKVRSAPHLRHLSLPELRAYRRNLTTEEERVSYWRRLVQSRLDHLTSTSQAADALNRGDLARALNDTGSGARRAALLAVNSEEPLPALPALTDPWTTAISVDPTERAAAEQALTAAAEALTEYRAALQDRLAVATGELITRYIENPEAAFDLTTDPSGSSSS